ncbi:SRPBCC family protein [Streptomyces sp. IBSBF 2953]|uniref:SRPBCC family protein n=1 Tax=Streptomyces TaxID=1883 RepID=UPI00211A3CFD|nr:SRPBCC family protein [Streptomyces scabiei]MCQ9183057.1 SRPBCC family protein [Streptomyces hayashii]MDX3117035.1 SRPBCC family protein [Streptomyces scabiei]
MSDFHESIDVDATPDDVWAYVIDPSHLPEWQASAVSAEQLDPGPTGVGSRVRVTRHVGSREMPMTMEYTEYDPPHAWALQGVDGPVRGHFHGEILPIDEGRRSRVIMDLDFEGKGMGKLLVPLVVRRQVRKEFPVNERLLKDRLEHRPA